MFDFETKWYDLGADYVCGIDEAGRGPLYGPVFAAAVILKKDDLIEGVNDSKKLSEKKREMLFKEIVSRALSYSVASASAKEIDEINILNATMLAMKRAFEGLNIKPSVALIDGISAPPIPAKTECVIKGDSKSASIAAASILAKVSRDRAIKKDSEKYPEYALEKHKGYGTKAHYEAILEHGLLPEHRRSFLKNLDEKRTKI